MMKARPCRSRNRFAAAAIVATAVLAAGPALIAQTKGGATATDKKPAANNKAAATGTQQAGSSAAQKKILQARQKLTNKRPQVGPPVPGATGRRPSTSTRNPKARGPNIPKPTVTLKPGEVPAIDFDTPEYKFGRVRSGSDIIHDFWFTNTGSGPLEILSVKPG
ncbi:MAG: hypothetical protein ACE5F9_13300 [Phycisphaerae bacterium]